MNTAVFALTPGGRQLALQLGALCGYTVMLPQELCEAGDGAQPFVLLKDAVAEAFSRREALVLVMACGIAVRLLAPLVQDKRRDPAVVVMDEAGRFAVSLLSGHWGGANRLAEQLAAAVGAQPVITTATDVHGLYAVDLLARELGVKPEPFARIKEFNAAMLRGETVAVFTGEPDILPGEYPGLTFRDLSRLGAAAEAALPFRALLTSADRLEGDRENDIYLRPPSLYVGLGCRRGTPAAEIITAILDVLARYNLAAGSLAGLASIDRKADEPGLLAAAAQLQVPVQFFGTEEIEAVSSDCRQSEFVKQTMGVGAVCEPTAILAARGGRLIVEKQKMKGITVAVAEAAYPWWESAPAAKRP